MYRLRALSGGERRRSCPGQYILGTLDGRAMEQKEWEGVSSALNRANPGVLCGRCCGMCESLDITSPWWMRDPPVWGGEKGRALAIGPPLLSVFLNGSVFCRIFS